MRGPWEHPKLERKKVTRRAAESERVAGNNFKNVSAPKMTCAHEEDNESEQRCRTAAMDPQSTTRACGSGDCVKSFKGRLISGPSQMSKRKGGESNNTLNAETPRSTELDHMTKRQECRGRVKQWCLTKKASGGQSKTSALDQSAGDCYHRKRSRAQPHDKATLPNSPAVRESSSGGPSLKVAAETKNKVPDAVLVLIRPRQTRRRACRVGCRAWKGPSNAPKVKKPRVKGTTLSQLGYGRVCQRACACDSTLTVTHSRALMWTARETHTNKCWRNEEIQTTRFPMMPQRD